MIQVWVFYMTYCLIEINMFFGKILVNDNDNELLKQRDIRKTCAKLIHNVLMKNKLFEYIFICENHDIISLFFDIITRSIMFFFVLSLEVFPIPAVFMFAMLFFICE